MEDQTQDRGDSECIDAESDSVDEIDTRTAEVPVDSTTLGLDVCCLVVVCRRVGLTCLVELARVGEGDVVFVCCTYRVSDVLLGSLLEQIAATWIRLMLPRWP